MTDRALSKTNDNQTNTNTNKHTPGPWWINKTTWEIRCKARLHPEKNQFETVAVMESSVSPAETEANARLIAAAPELLEALKHAESWITALTGGPDHGNSETRTIIVKAREAIFRAEGRA